jgi:hypothetical protein
MGIEEVQSDSPMSERVEISLGLVQDIEALGRRWRDWRRVEVRQSRAVELLCGAADPRQGPEITVGREEFNVAGEIMVCQHPGCGGFVRGLTRQRSYVYWPPGCECPNCGQRYAIRNW